MHNVDDNTQVAVVFSYLIHEPLLLIVALSTSKAESGPGGLFVIIGEAYAPGNGGHIFNSGKIYLLGGADHQLGNVGLSGCGIYNTGKVVM